MLDAATGKLLNTTTVGVAPSALVVSERTNRVFVLNRNYSTLNLSIPSSISVLDATTGALLRNVLLPSSRPGPNGIGAGPIVAVVDEQRARVIIATIDGQMLILDARTGAVRQARKNIDPCVMALDQRRGYMIVQGGKGKGPEPRPVGSHIYIIDDRSGRILHDTYILGGKSSCYIHTTMTVDKSRRDTALVAAALPGPYPDYAIYQIDVRSGRIMHTTNLFNNDNAYLGITAMVQDSQEQRVFLSFGTRVYVLESTDGHLLGSVALPQPISALGDLALVSRAGRLFVGDGNIDTIMVLDTRRLDALLPGG
jgi:DNA-binding beta-propeller fold protein YncE